ncbi:MAG: hypothetical protein D6788_03095, partial [Planctomycetota bacterium]
YAPGIRVDWRQRRVEVEAEVVLREGALELLACSPQTREHESVFVVRARPIRLFQAMGLIGLEPGRPVRYDAKTDRLDPPTGEPLRIRVRWESGRKKGRVEPASLFLRRVDTGQPPESVPWVFAGSRLFEDRRFGADLDGTVICVVDFDTALIAVGALHTADNAALWLEANTEEIPPLGTKATILIDAATASLDVRVDAEGHLWKGRDRLRPGDLLRWGGRQEADGRGWRIVLRPSPDVSEQTVRRVRERLRKAGIAADRLLVRPPRVEGGLMPRPAPEKRPPQRERSEKPQTGG